MAIPKEIQDHLERINREMGETKTDVAWLKREITSLRCDLKACDRKLWLILVGVIATIMIQILIKYF